MNEPSPNLVLLSISNILYPNDDPTFLLIPLTELYTFLCLSFSTELSRIHDDDFPTNYAELIDAINSSSLSLHLLTLYEVPLLVTAHDAVIETINFDHPTFPQ